MEEKAEVIKKKRGNVIHHIILSGRGESRV